MLVNQVDSFLHIGAMPNDVDISSGIHLAQKLAAGSGIGIVDRHRRHFANRLIAIQISVKQRIKQGHDEEKHDDAFIENRVVEFLAENLQYVMQPFHHLVY